jgi:hypothetical protein
LQNLSRLSSLRCSQVSHLQTSPQICILALNIIKLQSAQLVDDGLRALLIRADNLVQTIEELLSVCSACSNYIADAVINCIAVCACFRRYRIF